MFGTGFNEYLHQMLAHGDVAPATALILGNGDGRNGTWLASRGVSVTAVDISTEVTRQALAHDRQEDVAAERIVADHYWIDSNVWNPRFRTAMMALGSAFQTKGLGLSALCWSSG